MTYVITIPIPGAKNRKQKINQKKIENKKKIRKELSPLLVILTVIAEDTTLLEGAEGS